MPVKYEVKNLKDDLVMLDFSIEGGVLGVEELEQAVNTAPEVPGTKGVCISGRGPMWLYGALVHKYHYTKYVAVYEPRMNACIVVETHVKNRRIGEVIPL